MSNGELSAAEERAAFGDPAVAHPPRGPSLDMSGANGALFAAIAKAQAAVESVGKDGKNRDKGYNYATADSMIRGGRAARGAAGGELALVTAWTFVECEPPERTDSGQWPGALVTLTFALVHAGGGYLTGSVEGHAICSRGRPIDKAVAAAATYLEGFVERNLMRLDRAEEGADDVEKRQETDTAPARPRQQRAQTQTRPVQVDVDELLAGLNKAGDSKALFAAREAVKRAWPHMGDVARKAVEAAGIAATARVTAAVVPTDTSGAGATP